MRGPTHLHPVWREQPLLHQLRGVGLCGAGALGSPHLFVHDRLREARLIHLIDPRIPFNHEQHIGTEKDLIASMRTEA